VGPVEDPDFAKQNDRDSAARPLAYLPTKPLKQGFDVHLRQTASYGMGEYQLKSVLVLPLHSSIVLPLGTRWGIRCTACWMRIITIWADPPKLHRGP
jgi:hypothetical protein